jgi:antitoxin (DNA-binding transcriptional repressor) of toxin-antitoxin stability system
MPQTKTITATEFKAKCLEIFDHLGPNGIIVTKRGRPVARVLPERAIVNEQFIGSMKDSIEIKGEIRETGIVWDAQS